MTDLVSKEVMLALVGEMATNLKKTGEDADNATAKACAMTGWAALIRAKEAIRALPAVDPRSDLEALRDEFATPAALNREGDSEG